MLKKINTVKISLPENVNTNFDVKKVRGGNMFPEPYCNIFICAKKKSGKSTVIYNIINKCIDTDTKVYIFCSTVSKDASWIATTKYLDKKEIFYEKHQSLKDEDGKDILKDIIKDLQKEDDEDEEEEIKVKKKHIKTEADDEEDKPKKKRKLACENLFIFDDISSEIKSNKTIFSLLKQNRHYKSKVIISSQYIHDIPPQARLQTDYFLVFQGINVEKLDIIYKDADVNITFEEFVELYMKATEDKYNFLYIDVRNSTFRKNFNQEFVL